MGATAAQVGDLLRELVGGGGVVALTGAGISTASGIPDYRGVTGRRRTRPPMRWEDFTASAEARARYWARAQVGWRRYAAVAPNAAHMALAELEAVGLVGDVVTQNVDGLHQAAGSRAVVELHGSLAEVVCMACGTREPRADVQRRAGRANPWIDALTGRVQADGDAELDDAVAARFVPAACLACGGQLRPDVVFFGEFVPRERVVRAREAVETASCLLVLGSSLAVGSGYLLVRRAVRHDVPVVIVNRGPTRGDAHATLRVDGDLTEVLPGLVDVVEAAVPGDRTTPAG